MSIKGVIFDLDGTITKPILDFDQIRADMGLPQNAGPILEAMADMSSTQKQNAESVLDKHEKQAAIKSELHDGAESLLNELKQQGLFVAILTRNTQTNAHFVARKHSLEFDLVLGRDDAPAKPDPQGILTICSHFQARPKQTLMVGDYLHDIQCANNAGSTSVLLDAYGKGKEFQKYAAFTIENLGQILHIIRHYSTN